MMNEKKKGTPEGAPVLHKNGSTSLGKNQMLVDILLDLLDEGHRIRRPKNGSIDRELRELISDKNRFGEDVIINVGNGYFRAGPDDRPALREYLAKERSRAKQILDKADTMEKTWEALYGNI